MACMYAVIVFACMHTYHTYIHTHTEIHTYIHTYSYLRTVAGERERETDRKSGRGVSHTPHALQKKKGQGRDLWRSSPRKIGEFLAIQGTFGNHVDRDGSTP